MTQSEREKQIAIAFAEFVTGYKFRKRIPVSRIREIIEKEISKLEPLVSSPNDEGFYTIVTLNEILNQIK